MKLIKIIINFLLIIITPTLAQSLGRQQQQQQQFTSTVVSIDNNNLDKNFNNNININNDNYDNNINSNSHNNFVNYNGCNPDRLAVYKVVLHTYWTRDLFPKHYPDWRPPAQWTKTFGRSHDSTFNLFQLGKQASGGLKMFAEIGKTDNLELDERNQREKIYDEFTIPAINTGGGRSETNFFVDGNHSFVSLITRIVPSPDWFIGVDSFQLCVGGSWIDSVTVEMDPLDAGTDNGFTFTAPNWPTEPQGIIYRITSRYPAHPAGSFFYPNSKRLPPIATFQFIKLKEYELSEMFNHIEDDRKYETVKAVRNRLEIEHNHIEMNNELSADIEKERQHEVTQIPFRMTEKDKNRARILAKMKNEMNQTSNVIPKNDKNAILNNIAENYGTTKPQSQTQRKRQRNKKGRPPKDCRVSHWSEWSPCSKTCGIGEMHRYRKIIKHARRGGRPCPPLQESKWCGSARDCNSASNYFKW